VARVSVPYLDLKAQYRPIRERLHQALDTVLGHGQFILGPEVAELEQRLAETLGVGYVVTCNSGADALILALLLRGVGSGDEVITTSHSFVATANAIAHVGAKPVFVDIEADTMCIDPAAVVPAITPRTRAVIPVHLNGYPCDVAAIAALCREHDIALIEDCAQAIGASRQGRGVGSLDIGCFSLHPLKAFAAPGDGGFVTVTTADEAAALKELRNHGLIDRNTCARVGINSRLDTLQAAFLLVKLETLDAALTRRRHNAGLYRELLAGAMTLPPDAPDLVQTWSAFVVQHPKRRELIAALAERGVTALVHYPTAIHQQPAFAPQDPLPVTESVVSRIMSLPIAAEITAEQVRRVAATLLESLDAVDG
jgi:dTDP-4-amino-4,6-dideoxygalactose transaminase